MNSFTAKVARKDVDNLRITLAKCGLSEQNTKSEYEEFRFKGDNVGATMYSSGKLLLQGKGTQTLKERLFGVEEEIDFKPRIGSDEVGKGDYFGPMVIVACYVDEDSYKSLKELGVDDSKKLSDERIVRIAEKLVALVEYEKIVLSPPIYNELVEECKNVAIVLAKGHAEVLKRLSQKILAHKKELNRIVVDQFSKSKSRLLDEMDDDTKKIPIEQKHHGESDIAVAAASILARWIFLDEWRSMEDHFDFAFPKGASSVIAQGKVFVDRYGSDRLAEVAKIGFKTTKQVLEV